MRLLHEQTERASGHTQDYTRADRLNRLAESGFRAYAKLSDYDRAIDFLTAHHAGGSSDTVLYILSDYLSALGKADVWLREYERAVQVGITPRNTLSEVYHRVKTGGHNRSKLSSVRSAGTPGAA
ncbi:MAG: hypothetical protein JO069_05450 [Verrucomicrobia bacterium]|nr:hypothetical protein [Verrucomicrobiota bacterium]